MRNQDIITQISSVLLIILFLANDVSASVFALANGNIFDDSEPLKGMLALPEQAAGEPVEKTPLPAPAQQSAKPAPVVSNSKEVLTINYNLMTPMGDFGVGGIDGDEVDGEVRVVSAEQMPAIPREIQNLSPNGDGYMLTSASDSLVSVKLKIDRKHPVSKLNSAQVYYYDDATLQWVGSPAVKVDVGTYEIEGSAPSNTNYFAGMISTPEMPEAGAFVPTKISGIQAANPAAGMNIMQPPSVSRTGEASLSYPLEIPAGRQGMQPNLALNYSSDKGTGWMGVGWDISVPMITVDTRWGVPTFPANTQEEIYLLNGSTLVEEGGTKGNRNPGIRQSGTIQFFEQSVQGYKKIERIGTATSNYCWVVTTADQMKFYYGTTDGSALNTNAILRQSASGPIVSWYLSKVEDKWGNFITYTYNNNVSTTGNDLVKGGAYVIPQTIQYTGHGSDPGNYKIEFITSTGRPDATVNLKHGVKELDYHQLDEIEVWYGQESTPFKSYQLVYGTGDFGKTILTEIKEIRSGQEFYSHILNYHSTGLSYAAPVSIPYENPFNDIFGEMPEDVKSLAAPLSTFIVQSPINTSTSYGWGAGGSLGLGLAPGISVKPDMSKAWTFSGRLGFSQLYNRKKMFIEDMNGDGLPDLVSDKGNQSFSPLIKDDQGNITVGYPRDIFHNDKLFKSTSNSLNWGFDFTSPKNIVYTGVNWIKTSSVNQTYLTDYNADGIKDIVDGSSVKFGSLSSNGNLGFSTSSALTPNPVLKGQPAISPPEDDPLKDLEIVKIWEAPFTGTIDIDGFATLVSSSNDGVKVGIQHNTTMIAAMTSIDEVNMPMEMSYDNLAVEKGEKIMFRTYSKSNGFGDFITWNPKISYTGISKVDANGVSYSSNDYEDGFLISGAKSTTIKGDQAIKVDYPPLPAGGNLTDDVIFGIRVRIYDPANETLIADDLYQYKVPAGTYNNLQGAEFINPANSTKANFVGTLTNIPRATVNDQCYISFEVLSTSNVNWKQLDWRPEISLGNDPCGQPIKTIYPTVDYNTYNRLIKMEAPWTNVPGGTSTDDLRVWPNINFSNYSQAFTADDLINGNVIKDAYFVSKSNQNTLSRMLLRLKSDGTYAFYEIPVPGQSLSALNLTDAATVNSFKRSAIANQTMFTGFYSEDKMLADFLNSAMSSVQLYNLSQGGIIEATTSDYDIFSIERNELQDFLLHWGQFCWSNDSGPLGLIDPNALHLDNSTAMSNDFTDGSMPSTEELEEYVNENSSTPMDEQFGMLIPFRGEDHQFLPDYIYVDFAHSNNSDVDRWSAWGTHCGTYALAGGTGPGKFGEVALESAPPPSSGSYAAEGIPIKSKSKTFAVSASVNSPSWNAGLGQSHSVANDNKYFTQVLTYYRDINGDGYPDILINNEDDQEMQLTSSTGGYKTQESFFNPNAEIGKSTQLSDGLTIQGNYANEDERFQETQGPGGSYTTNFSITQGFYEWLDINGDGLPDRLNEKNDQVELNFGLGLISPANLSLIRNTSKTFAQSLGASYGMMDYDMNDGGKGYSVGIGLNNVSSRTVVTYMDLNGDNLPDKLVVDNDDLKVYINLGTSWVLYTTLTDQDIDHAMANGIYAHISGTLSFKLLPVVIGFLKLSITGKLEGNFAVNKVKASFIDMNGDGILDYVENDPKLLSNTLYISYGQAGKANLLESVTNPTKGSFAIEYKNVGNKYGNYPVIVKTHLTEPNETMVWDMPFGKWVMAELIINDGFEPVDAADEDIDGSDYMTLKFEYDGGIKSRRERQFLGFTRIETINSDDPNPTSPVTLAYNTQVREFARPLSNNPVDRRRFEYLKGLPYYDYAFYHEKWDEGGEPQHLIHLKSQVKYTYEPRNVDLSVNLGLVENVGGSPVVVNWNTVGESQSIFNAMVSKQELTFPDYLTKTKFHAQEYDITYDDYMNVKMFSRKGSDVPSGVIKTQIGSIDRTYYLYHVEEYYYTDVFAGNFPFDNPVIDPGTGDYCYTINPPASHSSYEAVELCIPEYVVLSPGPCANMDSPEQDKFRVIFRKEITESTPIYEETANTTWQAPVIATMDYFDPTQAADRTNALEHHKIYVGSTDPTDRQRATTAVLITSPAKLAAGQVKNWLDNTGGNFAISDLTYDSYGNVISTTGPKNEQLQRLTTNFTYDTDNNQFVTNVSNDYGDAACMKYNYATGNLLREVDINGHATAYIYDDFFRLKDVYGPREYEDASSAPTISFEYKPNGTNPTSTEWEEKVPVAITTHNMAVSADMNASAPAADCTSDDDFASRPAIANGLKTATFIDGLGRAVQIKKEAADGTSGSNVAILQVTGISAYDQFGRVVSNTLPVIDPVVSNLEVFNNNISAVQVATANYDYPYPDRVLSQSAVLENGSTMVQTDFNYSWTAGDNVFTDPTFTIESKVDNMVNVSYFDSDGNTTATVQKSGPLSTQNNIDDIITYFEYDELKQLENTTDPVGEVTSYMYDFLGRIVQEDHPDRGTTSFTYDDAGNLTKTVTPMTGAAGITMGYHYNRLVTRTVPTNGSVYDVTYIYGTSGNTVNGQGRVVEVQQGTNFKTENYEYDELGNLISEYKEIEIPNGGLRSYLTEFKYDSWGRMRQIKYPDNERVDYLYENTGELASIEPTTANALNIVDEILYDGFGNILTLIYGNGTQTDYSYNPNTFRLTGVNLQTDEGDDLLGKTYTYDVRGNVANVANGVGVYTTQLPNGPVELGGEYSHDFVYDDANRLRTTTSVFGTIGGSGGTAYSLTMTYDEAGSILSKTQGYDLPNTYDFTYTYGGGTNTLHQLAAITKSNGDAYTHVYNDIGAVESVKEVISGGQPVAMEDYAWDELGQMEGAINSTGIHHYTYDQNGERILKGVMRALDGSINGQEEQATQFAMDAYTLYVNPYYVVSLYNNTEEGSKHYYMNTQRVASAQISYNVVLELPASLEPYAAGTPGSINNLSDLVELFKARLNLDLNIDFPALLEPGDFTVVYTFDDYIMALDWAGCEDDDCKCEQSLFWATMEGANCYTTSVMYWYHPDYLGNVEFVTNRHGKPHQFFWYSPWGEPLEQQHLSVGNFNTIYFFNSKELDEETGLYYYGARYYNPKFSQWLSVDPLAARGPNITPYAFSHNNPIKYVDPDGMWPHLGALKKFFTRVLESSITEISKSKYTEISDRAARARGLRTNVRLWDADFSNFSGEGNKDLIQLAGGTKLGNEISGDQYFEFKGIKTKGYYYGHRKNSYSKYNVTIIHWNDGIDNRGVGSTTSGHAGFEIELKNGYNVVATVLLNEEDYRRVYSTYWQAVEDGFMTLLKRDPIAMDYYTNVYPLEERVHDLWQTFNKDNNWTTENRNIYQEAYDQYNQAIKEFRDRHPN